MMIMNIYTNDMYEFLLSQAKLQSFQAMQGFKTLQTERRGHSRGYPIEDHAHLDNAKEELLKAVKEGAEQYIRSYMDEIDSDRDYDFGDDAEAV